MPNSFFSTPIGQHGRHIKIQNLRRSWSKYGDIKLGFEKRTPEWTCQICGQTQPEVVDPFLFPMSDRELLRICSDCEHTKVIHGFVTYEIMVLVCRPEKDF